MQKPCIACGYHLTYPLYQPVKQPLAALHLPKSKEDAKDALTFPMNFRACAYCGHIFNVEFDYLQVPYEDDSNLMYNNAVIWQKYLNDLIDRLVKNYNTRNKTLIDIGCGDGGFLKLLIDRKLNNRCIGFEPGIEAKNALKNGLEVYKDYFNPQKDLKKFKPDFIICRHIIEHLENPRGFVSDIAYWSNIHNIFPVFLAEVPRIDKAVSQVRLNDYLYEHVSHFTEFSFKKMFIVSGYEILDIRSEYYDEVVVAICKPRKNPRLVKIKQSSELYIKNVKKQKKHVHSVLKKLLKQGKHIAFWGATGKGAAFLNGFNLYEKDFPIVVDSDYNKVGHFVPRTAQEILPPEYLLHNPVDIIVITTQWRAKDIYLEITRKKIPFEKILVLANQQLQLYTGDDI